MPAHPKLMAQNSQFPKELVPLAPNVYAAVGFAASNVHLIVGETGVIVIDTTGDDTSCAKYSDRVS